MASITSSSPIVVRTTATQTLSNKSMSGDANTFTNIPFSAVKTADTENFSTALTNFLQGLPGWAASGKVLASDLTWITVSGSTTSTTTTTTSTSTSTTSTTTTAPPAAQNLLLYSEQIDGPAWGIGNFTVTPNTDNDLTGGLTLDTITDDGSFGSITQSVTVLANTQYTLSFDAKRGTATMARYSIRDATNSADILIGGIARVDYYTPSNSSTPTRISVTFTTPVGCTSIFIYVARPNEASTGTTKIGRVHLHVGAAGTKSYVTTTSSNVP